MFEEDKVDLDLVKYVRLADLIRSGQAVLPGDGGWSIHDLLEMAGSLIAEAYLRDPECEKAAKRKRLNELMSKVKSAMQKYEKALDIAAGADVVSALKVNGAWVAVNFDPDGNHTTLGPLSPHLSERAEFFS